MSTAGTSGSLLIETTQYTGLWGIYDCGYRAADVDDLLTNTAGALVGALVAPIVAGWIPRPSTLAALPSQPVTRLRPSPASAAALLQLAALLASVLLTVVLPALCGSGA